jgi:hypothetical protein
MTEDELKLRPMTEVVEYRRSVTLNMDSATQVSMRCRTDPTEWYKAIGYLSSWNMSFAYCDIYIDGATDMVAVYRDRQGEHRKGERSYTIGAVWHQGQYGFHS